MEKNDLITIRRGEVYWCDLGECNGHIQRGKRPVIIIQNDVGNYYSPTTIVIPCSTTKKIATPCHFYFKLKGKYNIALCEQITTINKYQLIGYIDTLNTRYMDILQDKLKRSLGYENA